MGVLGIKRPTGLGEKPDDKWAMPLCSEHHREQHSMGEREFWEGYGIDPIRNCLALFELFLQKG